MPGSVLNARGYKDEAGRQKGISLSLTRAGQIEYIAEGEILV